MEKKNELFNLLKEDIKKKCVESQYMTLDHARKKALNYKYIGGLFTLYNVYIFSPSIWVHNIIIDGKHKNYQLPGDGGVWSDDKDSYIILAREISGEKDPDNQSFNIKILNFENPTKILYNRCIKISEMDCKFSGKLMNMARIVNWHHTTDINKIRKNLSCNVAEAIMDIYNTTMEDEYE